MIRKVFSHQEEQELINALKSASLYAEITLDPEAFRILMQHIKNLENKIQTMSNIIHDQQVQIEYYSNNME